ncbi:hypothetical protein TNCT_316421 [Trichonephila clavata]|uniref:Uncharacterized protein n=1 Tax=Trichonephila clavata TaxID=2740835 RepID=A0A8X6HUJ9_TRICU|nr:hypothetical protein TNCT_316421 [Trichonephila clavata]
MLNQQLMVKKTLYLKETLVKRSSQNMSSKFSFSYRKRPLAKNRRLIPPNFVVYLDSDGLLRVETKLFSTDTGDYFRRPIYFIT